MNTGAYRLGRRHRYDSRTERGSIPDKTDDFYHESHGVGRAHITFEFSKEVGNREVMRDKV